MTRIILFIIIISNLLLTSCSKDGMMDMNISGAAQGDVIIKASKQGSTVKYAIIYYAYSSVEMEKVKTYYEESPELYYELDTIEGKFTFALFPNASSFTDSLPKEGIYCFEYLFSNGLNDITTDYLSNNVIEPPMVENIEFNESNEKMTISWKSDTKVDNYKIMLVDNRNDIVYESNLLPASQNSISIGLLSKEWYSNVAAKNADSLRVVMQAYLFEPQMSLFDIQCISVNDQTKVKWGK